ncbi:DUF1127 domain-containing protein [Thalassovita taeanensis]|uniref:Uncharacterized conserved protein YjiS, DUF1127 family n=1 Tax=Thalassovita taeanensis TaxID=657014 RepID=A0A1H9ADP9_9RHOB|nr:DUF1127 domain-containing protein [Thalassovita taeanensis]SEP74780.1 Uncharacterized conserved protein YjiS, DUF1127 family [Thalassovita taeanensis]
MAVYDNTRTQYQAGGVASRISNMLASVIGAAATWNDARVTRNALSRLSDRELEDIGLSRGDIDFVVVKR